MQQFKKPWGVVVGQTLRKPNDKKELRKAIDQDVGEWGHWKRGICIRLSEIDFFSLRQICHNFAQTSSDVQNEIRAILLKLGAQFATNLRNAPLANAPFS